MEIVLKQGDRLTIPEGCKATINGNEVVIEKNENGFKDGDVLACKDSLNITCPFIYKNTDEAGFHLFYIGLNCDGFIEKADSINSRWGDNTLRLATEEEKQQLFDKMKEQGLRWNVSNVSMRVFQIMILLFLERHCLNGIIFLQDHVFSEDNSSVMNVVCLSTTDIQ